MINAATLEDTVRRLRLGERATLAQAMTLVESNHPRHQPLSTQLLDAIMPFTGNALRLGITGTPGAGKSTFLEAFGMLLIHHGLRVAVIAVDPSSPVSGGSILGDKTRMTELARAESAFIRPVPSCGHLGGASQRARELMLLCEAAGFDVVIVKPSHWAVRNRSRRHGGLLYLTANRWRWRRFTGHQKRPDGNGGSGGHQ